MKRLIEISLIIGLLSVTQLARGGSIPDEYNTGDTLTADKMNNIKSAVNDNDDRVSALEAEPKANTAAGAPTLDDDINAGFPVGSVWVDLTDRAAYILVDSTPGAAVWELVTNAPKTYAIGDTGPAGGIVFYVTNGGLHGLEAAPEDVGGLARWGCLDSDIPGAERNTQGTGVSNTFDILVGCSERPIAASIAAEYQGPNRSSLGGGWFLPSQEELADMYINIRNLSSFADAPYWSSTEISGRNAVSLHFGFGVFINEFKAAFYRIRPVRAF